MIDLWKIGVDYMNGDVVSVQKRLLAAKFRNPHLIADKCISEFALI